MNVHTVTPTQLRIYEERKARERRMKDAAARAKHVEAPQSKIIYVDEAAKRAAARARIEAIYAERRKQWQEIRAARAKERWRASWRYMVQIADEKQRENAVITLREILEQTAKKYGLTVNDLKSARRTRGALMQARFEFCWRCKRETLSSFPQIGRVLGGRDHTTIIHSVRKYDAMRHEVRTGERAYSQKTRNAEFIPDLIITDGDNGE